MREVYIRIKGDDNKAEVEIIASFKSMVEASTALGVSKKVIASRMDTNRTIKGLILSTYKTPLYGKYI